MPRKGEAPGETIVNSLFWESGDHRRRWLRTGQDHARFTHDTLPIAIPARTIPTTLLKVNILVLLLGNSLRIAAWRGLCRYAARPRFVRFQTAISEARRPHYN